VLLLIPSTRDHSLPSADFPCNTRTFPRTTVLHVKLFWWLDAKLAHCSRLLNWISKPVLASRSAWASVASAQVTILAFYGVRAKAYCCYALRFLTSLHVTNAARTPCRILIWSVSFLKHKYILKNYRYSVIIVHAAIVQNFCVGHSTYFSLVYFMLLSANTFVNIVGILWRLFLIQNFKLLCKLFHLS
jgi:hypothetical protein